MQDEFDICGTHIPYAEIIDYQIVQREYIYRPAYRERINRGINFKKNTTFPYEFAQMIPYASVLVETDREYKLATKDVKTHSVGEAIVKDIAHGLLSRAGSKLNRKRYHCKNIAGRCFTTYLDDIPAALIREDGKISDVYQDDDLHYLLGEPIAPGVLTVPALRIQTKKEEYLFFGNQIQLAEVNSAYGYLREKMEMIKHEKLLDKSQKTLNIQSFARKLIPSLGKRESDDSQKEKPPSETI